MKKFGLFLCLSLLFAFTGCSDSDDVEEQGGTVLAKPAVTVTTTTSAAFKVVWDAVPNAESYKYRLSQENESGDDLTVQPEMTTSATALTFGDLNPQTKYILRVKAVAAAGSRLSDSEEAKIFATTLSEKPVELTFEKIAGSALTYQSAEVELVPSADNLYYWQVVENSLIADKSDREIVAALKENIAELTSGPVKTTVSGLQPETQYTVVAFGYDLEKGQKTSAVACLAEPFTTPADTRMTIAITAGAVADNKVHVAFTPTPADGAYFADLVATREIAGMSETEIVALLQAKYGAAMAGIAHKGAFESDFAVKDKTNYTAVAFGYSDADKEMTTRLFTAEIRNGGLDADVSEAWADMTCIYGTISGSPALGVNIYPNEYTQTIKVALLSLSGSASSLEQIDMTPDKLRDMLLSQGETLTEEDRNADGNSYQAGYRVDYGKVYLIANVAIDATGKGGEANWMIVKAQTSAQTAPEILGMSERNDDGSGGGDEPASDAWADLAAEWEVQNGTPLIFFDCTPNESVSAIKYFAASLKAPVTSLEACGITEDDLRSMVLSDGGALNMERLYAGFYGEAGQVWLFAIVASDADGNYGEVNWIISQIPEDLSAEYGYCTTLAESDKNNAGGGGGDLELKSATYEDYLGSWTLISSGSAEISGNSIQFTQNPVQYSLRIEENVKGQSYKVYGWNTDTEFANAHPFVMDYDPAEDGGVSGWVMIPLAQKLATEGNIDWMLCPRFVANNSYYFYSNTDMSQAFYGATESSGMVLIVGNSYSFSIGEAQMRAMSIMGIDNTNTNAPAVTRPLETSHAVGPFILVKNTAAKASLQRARTGRTISALSHLASVRGNFARFSTAATLSGNPLAAQQVIRMPRLANGVSGTLLNDPAKPRMKVLRR